jgi:uncharacterized tellurite resistance protein B-like protein
MELQSLEFQEALAHLFYSVAIADKKITLQEKLAIKKIVEEDLLNPITIIDKTAFYEILKKNILELHDKEESFLKFKTFFSNNRNLFTLEIKLKIMNLVDEIATATASRNKSELVLLSKIHSLLFK